ncbi:MAG TPA: methyltransferase [Polyangiaceae bacterium]|nr:methyltransferase [Polyangiaceae bacterium]
MTRDAIFGGRVVLSQPARGLGYRVNADALLLADFAGRARGVTMDLGAGVGAVALVMLATGSAERAVLVDDDERACALARGNAGANGFGERARVVCEDALDAARTHRSSASLVVCNPPYSEPGTSRLPKGDARARIGSLERFVRAAREALAPRGRACFVYPAPDLARLLSTLAARGLHPKRLRFVHATASHPARVALVEARAARPGGLAVLPPLVERAGSAYTAEAARILGR